MNTLLINTRLILLAATLFLLWSDPARAQGFVRRYPFSSWQEGGGQTIFPKADGSFRLTAAGTPDFGDEIQLLWLDTDAQGNLQQVDTQLTPYTTYPQKGLFLQENGGYLLALADSNRVNVRQFDASGNQMWLRTVDIPYAPATGAVMAVRPNAAGDIFVRGYLWSNYLGAVSDTGYVFKLNAAGDLLWKMYHPFELTYVLPESLEPTADGGCFFGNYTYLPGASAYEHMIKIDGNGAIQYLYAPSNGSLQTVFNAKSAVVNSNLEAWVPFTRNNTSTGNLFWEKLDPNGQVLRSVDLSDSINRFNLSPKMAIAMPDGGLVAVVQAYQLNSWVNYVVRILPSGAPAWHRPLSFMTDAFPSEFADGRRLTDGSLTLMATQGEQLWFIKMTADGAIYPFSLTGTIARDSTFNCLPDAGDPPLTGWTVHAVGNNLDYFAASDAQGRYSISDLDSGAYQVLLTVPSYLWQPCADSLTIQFSGSTPQEDTLDFQVQSLYDCPLMQVDVGTPFLRRCMDNTYSVQYCNAGNQPAATVSVTLLLDPLIELESASIPYTQDGQLLTFNIGTVVAGDCGSFYLTTTTSCAAELGQTLCVEAHIYPDSICAMNLPNWSGAQVEVRAECAGDSVQFRILNTGVAPMSESLDFIIVDDHVITRQGNYQLVPGAEHHETVPADGSTWRLIAQQEPGFPLGPQLPSVGIEGCNGIFNSAMLNQFANYTGNPFHDIDCHAVIGSWDPNDKQAFPQGVDAAHLIDRNQPIEYLIRFQNTGTDTAFTVVLRDTLSAALNPASIRPGAASHPYTWALSGQGILTVTFSNILLPDSTTNEPASHGFVQFRIDQQHDLPLGTRIENRAGIYFDFNEPVLTNTVFHTVGQDFLPVSTYVPGNRPTRLVLWPNPAVDRTSLRLGALFRPGQRVRAYDALGRLMGEYTVPGAPMDLLREGLPAGLYRLELIQEGGQKVGLGNLIWVD